MSLRIITTMNMDHPLADFYRDIYGSYDRVNRLFTFGRDKYWRRRAVAAMLEREPLQVLDVCTGTGDLVLETAAEAAFRGMDANMVFSAYDMSESMLKEARRKLEERQSAGPFPEISFIPGEVSSMPFPEDHFHAMGISFGIRNLLYENSQAEAHLAELYRVLKPGGVFVILESSKPSNRLWRLFNNIYLRFLLPPLGGLVSGNFRAYRYLGKSSRNYYTAEEMISTLEGSGFRRVSGRSLFLGSVMLVVVSK